MVATELGKKVANRRETIRIPTRATGDAACGGLIPAAGIDELIETGEREETVVLTLLQALQETTDRKLEGGRQGMAGDAMGTVLPIFRVTTACQLADTRGQ